MQAWCLVAYDADSIDAVLGPILFVAAVAGVAWFFFRVVRRNRQSRGWTPVEATIQSEYARNLVNRTVAIAVGGVAGALASQEDVYSAVLRYTYAVAGESYSGYVSMPGPFHSRGEVSVAAQPWLGKKITVRYNPAQPHQSAYRTEDGAPASWSSHGDQPPTSSDEITTLGLK